MAGDGDVRLRLSPEDSRTLRRALREWITGYGQWLKDEAEEAEKWDRRQATEFAATAAALANGARLLVRLDESE